MGVNAGRGEQARACSVWGGGFELLPSLECVEPSIRVRHRTAVRVFCFYVCVCVSLTRIPTKVTHKCGPFATSLIAVSSAAVVPYSKASHYSSSIPAYTRSGVRIHTDPRIHTAGHAAGAYMHPLRICTHHSRTRTHPRIRTRVRICTRCVYAPDAAYTWGRDERHEHRTREHGEQHNDLVTGALIKSGPRRARRGAQPTGETTRFRRVIKTTWFAQSEHRM